MLRHGHGGLLGHTPSTAGTFRKKFRKDSGKTPETLLERFLEFPSRVRLGCPKPYNSRHLRLPERFQNYLPPSTAGDASFFGSGSGEGLPELVMEFPAVLGVFLSYKSPSPSPLCNLPVVTLGARPLHTSMSQGVTPLSESSMHLRSAQTSMQSLACTCLMLGGPS